MDDQLRVTHAPTGYNCPFCAFIDGRSAAGLHSVADDLVERTADTTTLVSTTRWPSNPVVLLVVPRRHVENIYSLTPEAEGTLAAATRRAAVAVKSTLSADGVTVRQHNEPAAQQTVWHLHVQVIPRWHGDRLYQRHDERFDSPERDRADFARQLRPQLLGT